jgi:CRP-like cAMP-binding protein
VIIAAMPTSAIAKQPLRLTLQPGDVLPESLSWKILDGYIRTSVLEEDGESIILGVWGPGDWVTAAYSALKPIEIQCISPVVVEQFQPESEDVETLLLQQIQNLEEIFQFNRIRSADLRLLRLLTWIGRRFGQVNSRGYRLSLKEMNLTHKSLADLCGLTRVTVTKVLNRYKVEGVLQQISPDDLFIPLNALSPEFA